MLAVMVATFVAVRVVLKSLGAEDYGIYNVVGGVVTLMVFFNSALGASTSRFLTYELGRNDVEKLKKTFSAALILHIFVAFVVFIFAETIGLWFFYNKLVIPEDRFVAAFWIYQFSILEMFVNFTQVPYNASLISHENMAAYAYVGLYEALSKLAIAFLIAYSPIDVLIFYGLLLLINKLGIQLFYRYYTAKRYVECKLRIVRDKQIYKELASYSVWDLIGGVAGISQGQGINILINIFFGPTANAARAIAVQISTAANTFVGNILIASRPQIVKRFANRHYEDMYDLTFASIKYSLLLVMAMVMPLILEIRFVLDVWLGSNYPQETILFTQIVLAYALIQTTDVGLNSVYHAIGKIKTGNLIGGSIMFLSLPVSYLFYRYGFPAYVAFIVVAVCTMLGAIITLLLVRSYVYFSLYRTLRKTFVPVAVVGLLSIVLPLFISNNMEYGLIRFVLVLLTCEISLFLLSWYLAIGVEERAKISSVVKNKILKTHDKA